MKVNGGVQFQWSAKGLEQLKAGKIPEAGEKRVDSLAKNGAGSAGAVEAKNDVRRVDSVSEKAGTSEPVHGSRGSLETGVNVKFSSVGQEKLRIAGVEVAQTAAQWEAGYGKSRALKGYQDMQNTIADEGQKGQLFNIKEGQ